MSLAWRLGKRFVETLLGGLLAGIVLMILAPVVIGWRPYTVLTGSMRPTIEPGDVVMDRPIRVPSMHVGDIVTFSDPTRGGKLVTHRVRAITHAKGLTLVETRGDANSTSERWNVASTDRVGKVMYVIPKVGHVANLAHNPAAVLLLVVVPVLGLGILALRRIWRDDEDEPAQHEPGEADDREPEPQPTPGASADGPENEKAPA
ncbi:MAG: signal peptidase I [Patulibacter minatonensis]